MSVKIAALVLLGIGAISSSAMAEEKAPARGRGVIEVEVVKIVGRARPILAADVARVTQKIPLAELRQPFVDRIEKAIQREPF
jgi:hypothetical protein